MGAQWVQRYLNYKFSYSNIAHILPNNRFLCKKNVLIVLSALTQRLNLDGGNLY